MESNSDSKQLRTKKRQLLIIRCRSSTKRHLRMKKRVPITVENKKTVERKNNFPAGNVYANLINHDLWKIMNLYCKISSQDQIIYGKTIPFHVGTLVEKSYDTVVPKKIFDKWSLKKVFWYSGPKKNSFDTVSPKNNVWYSSPQKTTSNAVVPKNIFWNSGPQKKSFYTVVPRNIF